MESHFVDAMLRLGEFFLLQLQLLLEVVNFLVPQLFHLSLVPWTGCKLLAVNLLELCLVRLELSLEIENCLVSFILLRGLSLFDLFSKLLVFSSRLFELLIESCSFPLGLDELLILLLDFLPLSILFLRHLLLQFI